MFSIFNSLIDFLTSDSINSDIFSDFSLEIVIFISFKKKLNMLLV